MRVSVKCYLQKNVTVVRLRSHNTIQYNVIVPSPTIKTRPTVHCEVSRVNVKILVVLKTFVTIIIIIIISAAVTVSRALSKVLHLSRSAVARTTSTRSKFITLQSFVMTSIHHS